jgi:hypothetical protein
MAVSVEEVHAEITPEPPTSTSSSAMVRRPPPPDMDCIRQELRRDAQRCARLCAD